MFIYGIIGIVYFFLFRFFVLYLDILDYIEGRDEVEQIIQVNGELQDLLEMY